MNGDNMIKEFFELLLAVIIFCVVLWLSYYVTRRLSLVNRKMGFNKNMEIIEVLPLMQGQFLYIVKAGGKYLLLSCSQKGNISLISELDEEQIVVKKDEKVVSFQEQLMHLMKGRQVREDGEKEK